MEALVSETLTQTTCRLLCDQALGVTSQRGVRGHQTVPITRVTHKQVAPIEIWGNKCSVCRWSVSELNWRKLTGLWLQSSCDFDRFVVELWQQRSQRFSWKWSDQSDVVWLEKDTLLHTSRACSVLTECLWVSGRPDVLAESQSFIKQQNKKTASGFHSEWVQRLKTAGK